MRTKDNTDRQFGQFRNGLPSLLGLAAVYLFFSKAYSYFLARRQTNQQISPYQKIPFLVTISLVILFVLHGISAFKVLLILYLNYELHNLTGLSRFTPYAIWSFNIVILFSNEIFDGYAFGKISPFLEALVSYTMRAAIIGPDCIY